MKFKPKTEEPFEMKQFDGTKSSAEKIIEWIGPEINMEYIQPKISQKGIIIYLGFEVHCIQAGHWVKKIDNCIHTYSPDLLGYLYETIE